MAEQRSLHQLFHDALDAATATRKEVAEGMNRGRRTVEFYLSGRRRLTPAAVHALVAYLRRRARELDDAADALEAGLEDDSTPTAQGGQPDE